MAQKTFPKINLRVDGEIITITPRTDIDDLSDAAYAMLDEQCEKGWHVEGACPLCAFDELELDGAVQRTDDKDYLGSLWGSWGGGSSQSVRRTQEDKLIRAHGIVKSFIDTFATGDIRYDVTFDPTMSTAGTDLRSKRVGISPAPALDPTLTPVEAGIVLTGMSVHEASHIRYGRRTAAAVGRAFNNDGNAHRLSNILDDVRIEARFAAEYPGYAHVFAPTLAYVAGKDNGEPITPARPLDFVCAVIRYSAHATFRSEDAAEVEWWTDWAARSISRDEPKFHVAAVKEGLDHIGSMPTPPPPIGPVGPGGSGGNGIGTPVPGFHDCVMDGIVEAAIENGVDPADIDGRAAQEAVNEAETLVDPDIGVNGHYPGEIRPASNLRRNNRIDTPEAGIITSVIRNAMMRSRTGRSGVEHDQMRGRLSSRSITKIALNDPRLFSKRTAVSPGRSNFWLLVDRSGSMSGQPTEDVVAVSKALASATRYAQNVRMSVYGWTSAQSGASGRAYWGAYRVWSTGEDVSRIGDLGRIREGGTPDLPVLAWAVDSIIKDCARGESPVIVMMSDGAGFGSTTMRPIVERAMHAGIRVISIAVGHGLYGQEEVYGRGNFVKWQGSAARTAVPLAALIAKATGA